MKRVLHSQWVQLPDSHHAGLRMGTALPWSSTGSNPWDSRRAGNVLRAPLGQDWPCCTGSSSPAQPRGMGGAEPQPPAQHWGSMELQAWRKRRKLRGASSPEEHTQPAWHTNQPRLPSSEPVLGNSFTKCHWSLEPNLMYRIYYCKQLVLAPLCTTCRRTPMSRLFTTDSFPFQMKENKNVS